MSKRLPYLLTCFILAGFLIGCNNSGGTNNTTSSGNLTLSKQQTPSALPPYFLEGDTQFTQNMNTVFAGGTFGLVFVVVGQAPTTPTVVSFENAVENPNITYNPVSCTITQTNNYCSTTVQVGLNTLPASLSSGYKTNVVTSGIVLESLTFAVEQPLFLVTPQPNPKHIAQNGKSTIGFTLQNIPTFNNTGSIIVTLKPTTPGIISIPTTCKIGYANGVISANTCASIPITGLANGSTNIVASSPNFKDAVSHFITVGTAMNYTYATNTNSNNLSIYGSTANGLLNPLNNLTQITGGSPNWTTFDPTGRFAYVTNSGSNTVSMYMVEANGALTPLSTPFIATGNSPITIAFDPTGRFAYVANQTSNSVSMYSLNQSTGILTSLNPNSIAAGTAPVGVTADPSGQYLYVTNYQSNNISMYKINQITGVLNPLVPTPTVSVRSTPFELEFDPAGRYAYVPNATLGSISVFSFNPATGLLTLASEYKTSSTKITEIRFAPNGNYAYITNQINNSVTMLGVNPNTGALTALNPSQISSGKMPIGLTFDASGQYIYVANYGENSISTYNFNSSTGQLNLIGNPVATGQYPIAITVN
jgi:6-phosphogluconolactonase (cycloisomerase 2 family)